MVQKRKDISHINRLKYALPPQWEQIQSLIDEFGMSYNQFERFYGLNYNLVTQIKSGAKQLPAHSWHLVYERIKPAYGVGFIEDYSPIPKKNKNKKVTHKPQLQSNDNHDRLISVK